MIFKQIFYKICSSNIWRQTLKTTLSNWTGKHTILSTGLFMSREENTGYGLITLWKETPSEVKKLATIVLGRKNVA